MPNTQKKKAIDRRAERWARKRLPLICQEHHIHQPDLTWRRSAVKEYTSGHTRWGLGWSSVVVTEGNHGPINYWGIDPLVDAKSVFLHEMAHAITKHGHDDKFYECFWRMARAEKLPLREVAKREARRGPGRRQYLATRPGRG